MMDRSSRNLRNGIITCLVFCAISLVATDLNPGLKVKIGSKALDYALSVANTIITEQVALLQAGTLKVPNITQPLDLPIGTGEITLTNVKVQQFVLPSIFYVLEEPNVVSLKSKNGLIKIESDWSAWYKKWFKVSQEGHAVVEIGEITLSATVRPGRSNTGSLTLQALGCSAEVGKLQINLKGGILVNAVGALHGLIERIIKSNLQSIVCGQLNKALQRLNSMDTTTVSIAPELSLDLSLASDPEVRSNSVSVDLISQFFNPTHPNDRQLYTPYLPSPIMTSSEDRMLSVLASESIVNSLASAVQEAGGYRYVINEEVLPQMKTLAPFLRTKCAAAFPPACIGAVLTGLDQFHNENVSVSAVHLSTSQEPANITFLNETITVNGCVNVGLEMTNLDSFQSQTGKSAEEAAIKSSKVVVDKIASIKVCASASVASLTVRNSTLRIERFELTRLEALAADKGSESFISDSELAAVARMALPAVNWIAADFLAHFVLPLPSFQNASLYNTDFAVLDGAVWFQTDFDILQPLEQFVHTILDKVMH